jgi:hypothetical protein
MRLEGLDRDATTTRVLLASDSRSWLGTAALLGVLSSTVCLAPAPAWAAEAPPRDEKPARAVQPGSKVEVMARAVYGDMSVGLLGLGAESTYLFSPQLGVGGQVTLFTVDNGADPHYQPAGTLGGGYHALAYLEGDLFPTFITPYGRVGLGVGRHSRLERQYGSYEPGSPELVAGLTAGVAVRGGPLVGRLSASPTVLGKDFAMLYSLGLGARF